MNKLTDVLKSRKFLVNLIGVVFLFFTGNEIVINGTPDELYNMFEGAKGSEILGILFTTFLVPITDLIRRISDKTISWKFVQSRNFVTFLSVALTLIVGAYAQQELASIIVSLLVYVANIFLHLGEPVETKMISPVTM